MTVSAVRGGLSAAFLAVLVLAGAGPARAVLPPQAYLEARREAALHVQMRVARVTPRPADEACRVEGRIVMVFRGQAHPGARIVIDAPCRFPGSVPMPGPVLWFQPGDLRKGQVLEGFLEGSADRPAIARSQLFVVSGESAEPRCGLEDYACR